VALSLIEYGFVAVDRASSVPVVVETVYRTFELRFIPRLSGKIKRINAGMREWITVET
jgi:hypothetical protein